MPAKVYLRFLRGGLIASLFIVFFVFRDLLFPYITSKQLAFNVLMEFLLAVWLVFIMRYPEYRPKKSYISWGLVAYFLAVLASIAVSVDPGLSFWGDAERMLGFFHLFHFLIFYFILITVFQTASDWRLFLMTSVAVATVISLIGVFGENVYTRIGNTAYVSGYLIFNLFFAVLLFLRSPRNWWRWLYVPALGFMLWEFALTRTSGAIIGLAAGLLLAVLLLGILHRDAKRRRWSVVVFLIAVLGILAIFSQSESAWFQGSFLRNLTSEKATFQTRLISWRGAAAEFRYHPLFGTGFGNYAIIFDKHFDPVFYNYDKVETYFDRAHNNLIDIASTTGLVGLITYLSIFVAAGYYLFKRFRASGGRAGGQSSELIVIIALLAAYFVQNLAIFDSYTTYIGLMTTLGYIYWLSQDSTEESAELGRQETAEGEAIGKRRLTVGSRWELSLLVLFLALMALVVYQYNYRPWRMLGGVIDGYGRILEGKLASGVLSYQAALIGTPLDQDGRVTLINLLTANPPLLQSLTETQAEQVLAYGIELAEKNVAKNPFDSLSQLQLAQIRDTAARYFYQDLDRFNYYSSLALEAIEYSLESSPGRVPVYVVKAQMQLARGEREEAIETLEYAISLNPAYSEGHCRLAQFYFFLETADKDRAEEYAAKIGEPLDRCVDLGGAADINSPTVLAQALNYYAPRGDFVRSLQLAERMVALNAYDAQSWLNLAKLYMIAGAPEAAEEAVDRAILLDKETAAKWAEFISTMRLEE